MSDTEPEGTTQPYLWRYRENEQEMDVEVDVLLVPSENSGLPNHDGEVTIVWW